ncbi:MAG: trypsin-like peptidase domain-containing protein [Deltaproteobacteria bacterium]|nr:trypsin-like peptidase domain-containing protein [Deltaproteobacteria bacterium]
MAILSGLSKSMQESMPFCERNIKGWIALLAIVAIVVLGVSVTMAATGRGDLGLQRARRMWAPRKNRVVAGPPGNPFPSPSPLASGAGPGTPVALPIGPQTWPQYAPPPQGGQGMPASGNNVDMVARATPGGGIKFIGGPNWMQSPNANTSFNRAASLVRPTVVSISAVRPGYAPAGPQPNGGNRFLDPFDGVPDRMVGTTPYETVGSGVIIDPAGYVVTNLHVIAGTSGVVASLSSEPENQMPAQVLVTDPANDLALLKIGSGGATFRAAALGDSSRLRVGDWVLAVGYPFGLELTVTAGIVGGTHVELEIGGRPYRALLQTDAPINKGSSGGPLVDMSGLVVGINTAIYAPTGVFSGTGFAIPSNRVGAFVARAMQSLGQEPAQPSPWQPVANPAPASPPAAQAPVAQAAPAPATRAPSVWLGLGLVDVTAEMASQLSYPNGAGAFVASVILDSPAEEAEIIRGDVIVSMAGEPVADVDTVSRIAAKMTPGQRVPVVIWRSGKTFNTTMKLRGAG